MEITEEQLKTVFNLNDNPNVVGGMKVDFHMIDKVLVMTMKVICFSPNGDFRPEGYREASYKIDIDGKYEVNYEYLPIEQDKLDKWEMVNNDVKEIRRNMKNAREAKKKRL